MRDHLWPAQANKSAANYKIGNSNWSFCNIKRSSTVLLSLRLKYYKSNLGDQHTLLVLLPEIVKLSSVLIAISDTDMQFSTVSTVLLKIENPCIAETKAIF